LNVDGRISDDEFEERNEGFNNEISAINQKIAKIQEDTKKSENLAKTMNEIRKVLLGELDFGKGFNSSIVDALIERVEIHKTETPNNLDIKVRLKAVGQTKVLQLKKTGRQGQGNGVKLDTGVCYLPYMKAVSKSCVVLTRKRRLDKCRKSNQSKNTLKSQRTISALRIRFANQQGQCDIIAATFFGGMA
jgi:hypothetical protein